MKIESNRERHADTYFMGKRVHQDKDIKIEELGEICKGEIIIRKGKEELIQEEDHIIGDIIDQNQEEIEVFQEI